MNATHRALLVVSLALTAGCTTTGVPSARRCFHSNEAAEVEIGYCEAFRDGRTLHVSGITGRGEMDRAVRYVYGELGRVLEANGFTFADVVKENVYATDLDAFIKAKGIRKEFYRDSPPAATWVQVARLYRPEYVLEVELTATKRQ